MSTGDLARVLTSGEVEVLGREGDSWARVLGYPVDLRRIERLLESHPAVKAAAVVPVAWRGRDHLMAWAVAPQESAEELSAFLAGTCPAFYLVPDLLICTSGLPLAGDAVDRDRLAALGREAGDVSPPRPPEIVGPDVLQAGDLPELPVRVLELPG